MTRKKFLRIARRLCAEYLEAVNGMIRDKKTEPEIKDKLVMTAKSLTIYIQDELEPILRDSAK